MAVMTMVWKRRARKRQGIAQRQAVRTGVGMRCRLWQRRLRTRAARLSLPLRPRRRLVQPTAAATLGDSGNLIHAAAPAFDRNSGNAARSYGRLLDGAALVVHGINGSLCRLLRSDLLQIQIHLAGL